MLRFEKTNYEHKYFLKKAIRLFPCVALLCCSIAYFGKE